jgi:prevent-host-death family protein
MNRKMSRKGKQARARASAMVNLYEAKTHLSALVARAARGEEITIAKAGRPMARLVPLAPAPREPGLMKGRIRIAADFDAPLPAAVLSGFSATDEAGL